LSLDMLLGSASACARVSARECARVWV
jgi:hypothetical protein